MPRVTPSSSDSDSDSDSESDSVSVIDRTLGLMLETDFGADYYECPCDCRDSSFMFPPGIYHYGYPCACPPHCFCQCSFNAMEMSGSFD